MFLLQSEDDTKKLAQAIAAVLRPRDCLTLTGTLGAGKTTLMRHLIHALGHEGDVISPTFMLVQEYPVTLPSGEAIRLHHMDAYRIEEASECEEIGIIDMLETGILCVEWPEICTDWLPKDPLTLTLKLTDEHRQARISSPGRDAEIETIGKLFHGS